MAVLHHRQLLLDPDGRPVPAHPHLQGSVHRLLRGHPLHHSRLGWVVVSVHCFNQYLYVLGNNVFFMNTESAGCRKIEFFFSSVLFNIYLIYVCNDGLERLLWKLPIMLCCEGHPAKPEKKKSTRKEYSSKQLQS